MQAVISRMTAASAEEETAVWKTAALPSGITGEPWELEGALTALSDVFSQLFPALAIPGDNLGRGIAQLDKIMPAIGDEYVDPASSRKFSFEPQPSLIMPPTTGVLSTTIAPVNLVSAPLWRHS